MVRSPGVVGPVLRELSQDRSAMPFREALQKEGSGEVLTPQKDVLSQESRGTGGWRRLGTCALQNATGLLNIPAARTAEAHRTRAKRRAP